MYAKQATIFKSAWLGCRSYSHTAAWRIFFSATSGNFVEDLPCFRNYGYKVGLSIDRVNISHGVSEAMNKIEVVRGLNECLYKDGLFCPNPGERCEEMQCEGATAYLLFYMLGGSTSSTE